MPTLSDTYAYVRRKLTYGNNATRRLCPNPPPASPRHLLVFIAIVVVSFIVVADDAVSMRVWQHHMHIQIQLCVCACVCMHTYRDWWHTYYTNALTTQPSSWLANKERWWESSSRADPAGNALTSWRSLSIILISNKKSLRMFYIQFQYCKIN